MVSGYLEYVDRTEDIQFAPNCLEQCWNSSFLHIELIELKIDMTFRPDSVTAIVLQKYSEGFFNTRFY